MDLRSLEKAYIVASILLIVLAYYIPYTILSSARDFSLYLFWLVIVVCEIILSMIVLYREGDVNEY